MILSLLVNSSNSIFYRSKWNKENNTFIIEGDTAVVTVPAATLIGVPNGLKPEEEYFFK